jgi:pimeloyl-ACP methyl ester carboxylesterase
MTLRWNPKGPARGKVVLLHEAMAMSATWWRIGPSLAARGWKVSAPDLAGHGRMPALSRPLDLGALVRGVVDRLRGQADVLVGHGLGAIVALHLAGRYPDIARAVVVEDPPGSNLAEGNGFLTAAAGDSALARSDRAQVTQRERDVHPGWADEDIACAIDGVLTADVPAILAGLRGNKLAWDIRHLLSYTRVPVLVLAAPDDRAGTAWSNLSALSTVDRKAIQIRLPAQHFVVLDGGHFLHRDAPHEWLEAFSEFADSVLPDTVAEAPPTPTLAELAAAPDDGDQPDLDDALTQRMMLKRLRRLPGGAKQAANGKQNGVKQNGVKANGAKQNAARSAAARSAASKAAAKPRVPPRQVPRTPPRMPGRR